ncbi:MAG: lipid-A-disaccharide synthase [Bacteroidia bacterium]|nr:lipid-A-disaccharide synthase [Bacteroidia bacterium]
MKYYIIAGERSGDLHGSNLIKALKKNDPNAILRGFGGDYMQNAGMELVVHYSRLAFMGFVTVIANIFKISELLKACKSDILAYKPDVIILIDYAGFNMRIAKFAKAKGLRVFYYISPKVWAWNTGRAWKLKANVDRMFCILPFEKDFYKGFDWDVDYVGSPVLDAVKAFHLDPDFLGNNSLLTENKIVALLPGSRKIELQRMLPVMAEVVNMNPEYQFVVAAVKALPDELYAPLRSIPSVKFIYDATYDLLSYADAAIVTSGTATLETSLFKVPQAVIYRASSIEYFLGIRFVKVKFISLVNLIANRLVIKEFLQHTMTPVNINAELKKILEDESYRKQMLSGYEEVYKILDTGSASENAGRLIVQYLTQEDRVPERA